MGSTRPNPTHVGWVGLGWVELIWWVGSGWIFFWPTMVGWVKKSPQPDPTRPMHTPTASLCWFDFLQLYFLLLSTLCYLCYNGEHNVLEWIWNRVPKKNCQLSNSSGKISMSLGGPVLSFSCKSKFLGSTSSVSWPAKEKYLSSTICRHKR